MTYNPEQARAYLASVLPWPEEGEAGFINVHWTINKNGYNGKPIWTGRSCRTLDEAVKTIGWATRSQDTRDVYACMSRQAETEEKTSATGHKYNKAIKLQKNALALKSLFLDIDFKGGNNGYDSAEDAVEALSKFISDASMPSPTMVVKSGGGLHVYWTFTVPVGPEKWQPLAYSLVEATKQHGLKCDTQCTIDSVRVLRVPGTDNHKTEPPKPVEIGLNRGNTYSVEDLGTVLAPYQKPYMNGHVNGSALSFPSNGHALEGISDLSAGILSSQPVELGSVLHECPFLADSGRTRGATNSNPLWNLTTLIATFTNHEREAAHFFASGHPGYTKESTDELYDRKVREKEEKGLGWPACRTISASGANQCQSCKHLPEGKSPLHFGLRVPQEPTETDKVTRGVNDPDLPPNYVRDDKGRVSKVAKDEDNNVKYELVCEAPMIKPWLQRDPWILNFTTHTDRPQKITIPTAIISTNEMRKELQSQGLMLAPGSMRNVEQFMYSWIETLKKSKDGIIETQPFGWNVRDGKLEGFVYGGFVHMPHGDKRVAPNPDPVLSKQYSPTGSIDPWFEAVKLITDQNRPTLNAILATSFGAPLVRFTNKQGLLMSAYSQESGIGKSTALKVAQAVWGHPVRGVQTLSDTTNSVINKMGAIKAIPTYWDELKTENDTKKFVDMTFRLSQGTESSRLKSDASQRDKGDWQTILVAASNDSLLDFVASKTKMTTAGIYRVFELTVPRGKQGQISDPVASRIIGRLNDNFGAVGLQYAEFLGANYARIEEEVVAFNTQLNLDVNSINDERLWTAVITIVCMGARYAKECGFCDLNEDSIREIMLKTLEEMREERRSQPVDMTQSINVATILSRYLSDRSRQTLYTNKIWQAQAKPPKNAITNTRPTNNLVGVSVQVGEEDRLLRVSTVDLGLWLADHGYSKTVFKTAMVEQFGCKVVRGRLGSGTEFHSNISAESLYEMYINKALSGDLDID